MDKHICSVHHKSSFTDQETAEAALKNIRANPRTRILPCRAYQDPVCGWWHLTSRREEARVS